MSSNIEILPVGGKFHVIMNGTVIHKAGSKAAADITVERERKKHSDIVVIQDGVHVDAMGKSVEYVEKFDIKKRMAFLRRAVRDVARGESKSVVIVGQGGLGKTHNVVKALAAEGLEDYDTRVAQKSEEIAAAKTDKDLEGIDLSTIDVPKLGTYKKVSGKTSPKALYRTLWENHDGLIMFDDCDSIQKDGDALNILKAALDTQGERIISWLSEGFIDDGLPRSFKFQGRIIFLSNKPLNTWDGAVKSRANCINVHMTKPQIVEYMDHMIHSPEENFMMDVEMERKEAVMALIVNNMNDIPELNLRNLIKGINAYKDESDAEYTEYLLISGK